MPAIIIELKVLSSETANEKTITEQLQALSRDALLQIDEKEYALPLEERGLSIMKLGIAFYKK